MSPPPAIVNQRASARLFARIWIYADDNDLGEALEAPCGVRLPDQPVPVEPDILFIKKEKLHILKQNYVEGVPDLIIEILSPSNPSHDLKTKYTAYESAGVSEYWIVNYLEKTVTIYRLSAGVYECIGSYGLGDTVESTELSGFQIAVSRIFNF